MARTSTELLEEHQLVVAGEVLAFVDDVPERPIVVGALADRLQAAARAAS